jgi:peptidoglycan/xylan/chitin deacetylase (PgdA/CDA1 family)
MGGGIVVAAVALWQNVDVQGLARRASAVSEPLPVPADVAGPMAVLPSGASTALLASPSSAGYYPDSKFYPALLRRWEDLLADVGLGAHRVSTAGEIEALDAGSLLVAPHAVCLSRTEVQALHRHLARGGGLILSWATAVRDEACEWRGWDALLSFTGAEDVIERQPGDAPFLTVPTGFPLAVGLAPGSRLEVFPEAHLALSLSGPRAYWSDWALNPVAASANAAAVLFSTADGGRVAWFGFRPGQGAQPNDEWRIRRILQNGSVWASGGLLAEIAPWPNGHRAAAMIGLDVESGFRNAEALARVLETRGAKATFFAVSDLVTEEPELASVLLSVGEIGSQTADHKATIGLSLSEQTVRLEKSWTDLRAWSGVAPVGLRPPEERFDALTLRAWRELGGTYVAAVNYARSATPDIFETPGGAVVLLPRLVKDDYNVFVQDGARRSSELRDAWMAGIRKLGPLGGLAYLSLHTQIAGTPERVSVVGEVIDSLRAADQGWWLAQGSQIADWWLARARTTMSVRQSSDEVVLDVTAGSALAGAWVEVYGDPILTVTPRAGDTPLAHARTAWGVRFQLPDQPAGGRLAVNLHPELVRQ